MESAKWGVTMVTSLSGDLGALALIETVAEIIFFVAFVSAFAMFFIVAIGNRSDADPSGSRPIAAVTVHPLGARSTI